MEEPRNEIAVLIELVSKLNDRLADYQVRLGLVEHALATFAFSNDPQAVAKLTNSLELIKLDWIEQGSPNTKHDLISVLKMGTSQQGPNGFTVER